MPAPASDLEFLGLDLLDSTRSTFVLERQLARPDGRLYGGTAVAVAVALAEQATDRAPIWTTVQFVRADTSSGDRIDCTTEVLNSGRRSAQVRIIGRVGDSEVFCALAATGEHKRNGVEGVMERFPQVLPPEVSPRYQFRLPIHLAKALGVNVDVEGAAEFRIAMADEDHDFEEHEVVLWTRVPGHIATPAILGFLGDLSTIAVVKAAGATGGGVSLDNTVRFAAPATEGEWVLAQIDPHFAAGGYAHGSVHLWSETGRFLGTAAQTSQVRVWD
ncbi:MAG: thioesterase family protein [Actinomycetota bacterium]|jgi:acyl-CoA thioesterase-2|nr:thioesterase family protein [Actinomycetota bacterium]